MVDTTHKTSPERSRFLIVYAYLRWGFSRRLVFFVKVFLIKGQHFEKVVVIWSYLKVKLNISHLTNSKSLEKLACFAQAQPLRRVRVFDILLGKTGEGGVGGNRWQVANANGNSLTIWDLL